MFRTTPPVAGRTEPSRDAAAPERRFRSDPTRGLAVTSSRVDDGAYERTMEFEGMMKKEGGASEPDLRLSYTRVAP